MKPLLFISFLLMIVSSMAQSINYQSVFSNRTALFKNVSNNQIIGLRIDSVKNGNNKVLYPFATIQEVSTNCISPYKASWIGEKIVVKSNGINLFFNRNGDSISINTLAELNETWIAFNKADSLRVEARVQSIEPGNVLGLVDTLKTIVFRAIDQNGNTVANTVNEKGVIVSKNHGFLEALNFYLFPNHTARVPADNLNTYNLVGLTNPNVGIQNLTWFEVNNYNVGDELHVRVHNTGDYNNYEPLRDYDNRCIYKYIDRTNYLDSIVYRYARQQSINSVYTDSTNYEYYNDTVRWVVYANPIFDKLPAEPVVISNSVSSMYMLYNEFREKIDLSNDYLKYIEGEKCYITMEAEGCLYKQNFIEGLGGPYYYCSGYFGETKERKLVYYKKGTTEWGTKLELLTSVPSIESNKQLQVFHNPTTNDLTFKLKEGLGKHRVNIFNQAGQLIISEQFEGSVHKLSIAGTKRGFYLYRFTTDRCEMQTGKVVVMY